MTAVFSIRLPWPEKALCQNARVHRAVKWKAIKAAREFAHWSAISGGAKKLKIDTPLIYNVEACPPTAQHMLDDDNLLGRLKAARDGVADALGMNDRNMSFIGPIMWLTAAKPGYVDLTFYVRAA
jgi:crossover junction endodeoxyribonuclease RusA